MEKKKVDFFVKSGWFVLYSSSIHLSTLAYRQLGRLYKPFDYNMLQLFFPGPSTELYHVKQHCVYKRQRTE